MQDRQTERGIERERERKKFRQKKPVLFSSSPLLPRPYEKAQSEEVKKKKEYFALAAKVHDLESRIGTAKQYHTSTSDQDVGKLQVGLK